MKLGIFVLNVSFSKKSKSDEYFSLSKIDSVKNRLELCLHIILK
jgi:hypothetical protein